MKTYEWTEPWLYTATICWQGYVAIASLEPKANKIPACFDKQRWAIDTTYQHTRTSNQTSVPQIPMRTRLSEDSLVGTCTVPTRLSKERRLFESHKLETPPQWNFQTHIGTGGFAKVYLESITRPVFGKHPCAVKKIIKEDVKFPRKAYEREIEIFSKLKQVSTLQGSLGLLARTVCIVALAHPTSMFTIFLGST